MASGGDSTAATPAPAADEVGEAAADDRDLEAEGYVLTPFVLECIRAPLVPQRSDEWFRLREGRITGSIVDSILGTNPFNKYEDLVLEKAGMPTQFHGNEATRHGTLMEPVATRAYERLTGRHVCELGLTPHPTCDILAHSPDGIAVSKTAPPVLIEIKCPLRRKITNKVPKYYMGQIQLGLEVFDLPLAHFVQFRQDPYELVITDVHREPDWLKTHLPTLTRFWDEVGEWKQKGWRNHPLARRQAHLEYFRQHCVC